MTRKDNPFTIQRIENILTVTGWTQGRLARVLQLNGQAGKNIISRWMRGVTSPNLSNQRALLQIEKNWGIKFNPNETEQTQDLSALPKQKRAFIPPR